jgi:hypothetical protein
MSSHQPTLPDHCPNCDAPRTGKFCANCGQKMELHREGFGHMIAHFVGHYFHYDSKFWTTLKLLMFNPGALTRLHYEGKRASFINPIQLYIFVSALFFLVFLNSLHFYIDPKGDLASATMYVGKEKHRAAVPLELNCDSLSREHRNMMDTWLYEDSIVRAMPVSLRWEYLNHRIGRNLSRFAVEHSAYSNGAMSVAMMNIFIKSIPKMFFVLLPWFAFLLMLLFNRRGKYLYVDHAVFALHFHAFVFISMMIGVAIKYLPVDTLFPLLFMGLIPIVYFFLAVRNFYRKSWLYTLGCGALVGTLYLASLIGLAIVDVLIVMLSS